MLSVFSDRGEGMVLSENTISANRLTVTLLENNNTMKIPFSCLGSESPDKLTKCLIPRRV